MKPFSGLMGFFVTCERPPPGDLILLRKTLLILLRKILLKKTLLVTSSPNWGTLKFPVRTLFHVMNPTVKPARIALDGAKHMACRCLLLHQNA